MKRPDLNNFLFGVGEGTGTAVAGECENFQFTATAYNPGFGWEPVRAKFSFFPSYYH